MNVWVADADPSATAPKSLLAGVICSSGPLSASAVIGIDCGLPVPLEVITRLALAAPVGPVGLKPTPTEQPFQACRVLPAQLP